MLSAFGQYDEPHRARRGLAHRRAPARHQHHRRPGACLRDRPGAARPGPGAPLHAPRRPGRDAPSSWPASGPPARVAFGKPIANLGGNRERLAHARIAINQARLLVLHAAWKLDTVGHRGRASPRSARSRWPCRRWPATSSTWRSSCTAEPGCARTSRSSAAYAGARSLRLADGPDEVHLGVIARHPAAPLRREGEPLMTVPSHPIPPKCTRHAVAACAHHRRRLGPRPRAGQGVRRPRRPRPRRSTSPRVGRTAVPEGAAYLRLDVRSQQDWDAALAHVRETWGGLDILVNNAGVATGGRIDVEAISDWERVLDINLLGVVRGCHTFTPLLKEQRSRPHRQHRVARRARPRPRHVVLQRHQGRRRRPLARRWRSSSAPWDIDVSAVCPAFFRTNLHESLAGQGHRDGGDRASSSSPRRTIDADDIAAIVLKGIDKHKRIILTDRLGRQAYWTKRLARPALRPRCRPQRRPAAAAQGRRRCPTACCRDGGPRNAAPVRDEDAFDVEARRDLVARERSRRSRASTAPPRCGSSSVAPPTSPTCCATPTPVRPHPAPPARRAPRPRVPTTCAASTTSRPRSGTVYTSVPRMVAFCGDESVIGSEFYVMERSRAPSCAATSRPSSGSRPRRREPLCRTALDTLVDLHRRRRRRGRARPSSAGPGLRRAPGDGVVGRYRKARTPDVGDRSSGVMAWLEAHRPDDVGQVLIHNDFRFDNLVLAADDPTRIVGVLDWEMATVGDPLMDLGGATGLLGAGRRRPGRPRRCASSRRTRRGMLTRVEVGALLLRPHGHPDGRRAVGASTRCSASSGSPSSRSRSTCGPIAARRRTRRPSACAGSSSTSTSGAVCCCAGTDEPRVVRVARAADEPDHPRPPRPGVVGQEGLRPAVRPRAQAGCRRRSGARGAFGGAGARLLRSTATPA